jgi:hypothetical protein
MGVNTSRSYHNINTSSNWKKTSYKQKTHSHYDQIISKTKPNSPKRKSKLKQEELLGKINQRSNGTIHKSLNLLVTNFMQLDK